MNILALDIGLRHTGVAYADSSIGIPFPLDAIEHTSVEELGTALASRIADRSIEHVVVGLPLLPDGSEGEQAVLVREAVEQLKVHISLPFSFIDERYSNTREQGVNSIHSAAASAILGTWLDANTIE